MKTLFFELIQVAIGRRDLLSRVPSADDWNMLYGLSVKQAVAGVCFVGVQRLSKEQREEMPKGLLMQWFALATQIQVRNKEMNRKCAVVYEAICREGFRCVVLKGQGIAELYYVSDCISGDDDSKVKGDSFSGSLGLYRQSGDIDVWLWKEGMSLKENKKDVLRLARSIQPKAHDSVHHVAVEWMGTEVELHYWPSFFYNPFSNSRFVKWFMGFDKSKFQLTDNGFLVPNSDFNLIFLLSHAYRHYVREGLGLRQVMDYYFLLKYVDFDVDLNRNRMIKELRMARFEKAMKWVIGYVFEGKDIENGRECGKLLLAHIMDGVNFGKHKVTNVASKHTHIGRFINQLAHDFHLVRYFACEAIWVPLSMIEEFIRIRV